MAQATQKTTPTQAKSVASSKPDVAKPTSRFRLPSFLSPNNANGTPRSGWSRLFIGMAILLVGLTAIQAVFGIIYTHLSRSAQDALQQPLASKDTLILGGLSGESLILILLFGALYIALFRFNVLPRDVWNRRASTQTGATNRNTTNRNTTSTVNLAPQTRASRRQAAATAAANATANAKNGKNGKNNAKAPAPLMKTKAGQSTVNSKSALDPAQSGTHDAEYERVKALQRQQRRREAKR